MAFDTHALCPYVYGSNQSKQTWSLIFRNALTSPQDIMALGDSRFTSPTGRGIATIGELNRHSAAMYGGLGALPWTYQTAAGESGAPPGTFPYNMQRNGQGTVTALDQAFSQPMCGLPNWFGYSPPINSANGGFGVLAEPDWYHGDKSTKNTVGGKLFDKNQSMYVDVLVSNPAGATSGGIKVDVLDATANTMSWAYTPLGSITDSALGLNSATVAVLKKSYGPYTFNAANTNVMLNIRGDGAVVPTPNCWIYAARPRFASGGGLVFTPAAMGGAKLADYLSASNFLGQATMANAGNTLVAMGFKGIFLLCGQNDANAGTTQPQMKTNLKALIAQIRTWVGWNIPVAILGNPYCPGLTAGGQTLDSTYTKSYTETCDEVADVIFFNLRRQLEECHGWNITSSPTVNFATANAMPAGWTYQGDWVTGTAYTVSQVVTVNGLKGASIVCSGGSGTFTVGETITQGAVSGVYLGEGGGVVYVMQSPGSADFITGVAIVGGTSAATRATVTAINKQSQFYIGWGPSSYLVNPRQYWRCIFAHTASWTRHPGSIQQTPGHPYWEPVYPYFDPIDPAHWHGEGAKVFADSVFTCVNNTIASATPTSPWGRR